MRESLPAEFMRLVPAAIAFLAMIAVVVFMLRWKAREQARRVELWRKFALDNRLQLQVQPDTWLKSGRLAIRGRIGEIELLLETYPVRVGKSRQTWTRVHSSGSGPSGRFSVQRRNFLTRMGGLFGVRGVTIDGAQFDEQFLVRSEPADLAPELLEQDLRARTLQG